MLNKNEQEMYERWGKDAPSHTPHGTDEEISEKLQPLQMTNWRMEGNKLIATTPMGEVAQYIPTDYIFDGLDEQGLPKLKKVVV